MKLTTFDITNVSSIKYEASAGFAYLEIEYELYPTDWDGLCIAIVDAGATFNGFTEYDFFYFRPVNAVPYGNDDVPVLYDADGESLYDYDILPDYVSTFKTQLETKRVSLTKNTAAEKDLYVAPYYQINGKRYIGLVVKYADLTTGVNFVDIGAQIVASDADKLENNTLAQVSTKVRSDLVVNDIPPDILSKMSWLESGITDLNVKDDAKAYAQNIDLSADGKHTDTEYFAGGKFIRLQNLKTSGTYTLDNTDIIFSGQADLKVFWYVTNIVQGRSSLTVSYSEDGSTNWTVIESGDTIDVTGLTVLWIRFVFATNNYEIYGTPELNQIDLYFYEA